VRGGWNVETNQSTDATLKSLVEVIGSDQPPVGALRTEARCTICPCFSIVYIRRSEI
jgi:hypothetical protein